MLRTGYTAFPTAALGGGFDPLSLSPKLWLDPNAANVLYTSNTYATPVTTDGTEVGGYKEVSGNNLHFFQDVATKLPLLKLNIQNGRNVLRFDGVNDFLYHDSASVFKFLHSAQATVYAVVRFGTGADPNAAYGLYGSNGASTGNVGAALYFDDRVSVPRNNRLVDVISNGSSGNPTSNNITADDALTPNAWHVVSHRIDVTLAAAARSVINVDGGADIANNAGATAASSANSTFFPAIGAAGNNVFPAVLDLGDFLIYPARHSDADKDRVKAFLNQKWGL